MNRLRLTHLTFVGPGVEPAAVEFDPSLTVVHGPSDTGKTYVADAVSYLLGGPGLRAIPEAASFTNVLLGLLLADGREITLERSLSGGRISLYDSVVREFPSGTPSRILASKHDPRSDANISRYLLQQIELDEKRIKKNARNETNALSFRNLAMLCIVNEEKVQSRIPPFLSGQYVTRTLERSVIKLLLEGEDDSGLRETGESDREKNIGRGKQEMLDAAVAELQSSIPDSLVAADLEGQLRRVNTALSEALQAVEGVVARRDEVLARRSGVLEVLAKVDQQVADAVELRARFALLLEQYDSDLRRLDMIREAGSFLGYFTPGVCVFCGAAVEHQDMNNHHMGQESTSFARSVDAETERTRQLRDDLVVTIADLSSQVEGLRSSRASLASDLENVSAELTALERTLQPNRVEVRELLNKRSELERYVSVMEQVRNLNALRGTLEMAPAARRAEPEAVSNRVLAEYSSVVRDVLRAWVVPDSERVDFDAATFDLTINGQERSARGKGMRAILHAAASIALMQYCEERDLPHPGFLLLDSPLVTYRQPDVAPEDEAVDDSVANAFFEYLERESIGQVLVLENTDPPALKVGKSVHFTKNPTMGRYGLFPAIG